MPKPITARTVRALAIAIVVGGIVAFLVVTAVVNGGGNPPPTVDNDPLPTTPTTTRGVGDSYEACEERAEDRRRAGLPPAGRPCQLFGGNE